MGGHLLQACTHASAIACTHASAVTCTRASAVTCTHASAVTRTHASAVTRTHTWHKLSPTTGRLLGILRPHEFEGSRERVQVAQNVSKTVQGKLHAPTKRQ